jgi:hypothetical protein
VNPCPLPRPEPLPSPKPAPPVPQGCWTIAPSGPAALPQPPSPPRGAVAAIAVLDAACPPKGVAAAAAKWSSSLGAKGASAVPLATIRVQSETRPAHAPPPPINQCLKVRPAGARAQRRRSVQAPHSAGAARPGCPPARRRPLPSAPLTPLSPL